LQELIATDCRQRLGVSGSTRGAFCADATALANKSSASLNKKMRYRKIIVERFTYHFVVAVWRAKRAQFPI
jgi:hypothetical protein